MARSREEVQAVQEAYYGGVPVKVICERFGFGSTQSIYAYIPYGVRRGQLQLVDPEMASLMASEGLTLQKIAAVYGSSAAAVSKAIKRYRRKLRAAECGRLAA